MDLRQRNPGDGERASAFRPQTREQAGREDACFSQAAAAVEDEQRMTAQTQMDFRISVSRPKKKARVSSRKLSSPSHGCSRSASEPGRRVSPNVCVAERMELDGKG